MKPLSGKRPDYHSESQKVKGEYLDNLIAEEEITSESLQAARHFQVDSTGTALTPVYEWKEDHSDEAQQLRQESFLNHLWEICPNGLRST